MRLLYATTNKGKLSSMSKALYPLGIEIFGLDEIECQLPVVIESGRTPLENAQLKAKAYYEALRTPLFSCDSGLYFDNLDEELQPGLHIRRIEGKELSDEEMIAYYSKLAKNNGGELVGRYKNAICLILAEDESYSSFDESLWTEPFLLSAIPHSLRVPGFPLDSLSIDIKSGKYYYDLDEKSVDQDASQNGFRLFFHSLLTLGSCSQKQ